MPPAIKVHVIFDRTKLIRAAIADVQLTIVVAIGLVVLVVALFLRRTERHGHSRAGHSRGAGRDAGGDGAARLQPGQSDADGITVAIGFVVDDAVIMIENIMRHMEAGERPLQAALAGARQIGFTVLSISAALIAALIPVLFMPDVVGRYFREFGITLVAAIVASALVSLTLTPMLCSRFLRQVEPGRDRRRVGFAARVSAQSRLGAAPSRTHCGGRSDRHRRQACSCISTCRRGSCRRRIPA